MQKVEVAHLRDQGIDFAVFNADAPSRMDRDRAGLLARLTMCARQAGLRIDKSALASREGGTTMFYGTPDLVRYLCSLGFVPQWTHTISV